MDRESQIVPVFNGGEEERISERNVLIPITNNITILKEHDQSNHEPAQSNF